MEQDRTGWVRRQVGARDPIAPAAPDPRDASAAGPRTFVFQGAEFEGTLRLRESFRIDSEFRGRIFSEGVVTVGETAGVEATICAREVIILGAVVGNISASRQLVLHASGRLHGDVETPCLAIEKGAVFNGKMTMFRPEVVARAGRRATEESAEPLAAFEAPLAASTQPERGPRSTQAAPPEPAIPDPA